MRGAAASDSGTAHSTWNRIDCTYARTPPCAQRAESGSPIIWRSWRSVAVSGLHRRRSGCHLFGCVRVDARIRAGQYFTMYVPLSNHEGRVSWRR